MWNLEHSVFYWLCNDWGLDSFKEGALKQKNPGEFQWNKINLFSIWIMLQFVGVLDSFPAAVWAVSSTGSVSDLLESLNQIATLTFMCFLSLKDYVILYRQRVDVEGPHGNPEENNSKERWAVFSYLWIVELGAECGALTCGDILSLL